MFKLLLKTIAISASICALIWTAAGVSQAQGLTELLQKTVENHERVVAAKSDVAAAQRRARSALGDWFPTLDTTANYGFERQYKHESANTSTSFNEFDLKLTQLLWDFGKTNATVRKAALNLEKAEVTLATTRQNLMLEAATAYLNLIRTKEVLEFARQSEENIRKQTGLEEALVETGSGLSTDVLQAKSQLAGAEARRIQNEGTLITARNRFRAIFGFDQEDISNIVRPKVPIGSLPSNLADAIENARDRNNRLKTAGLDEQIAREDIRETRGSEFFPTIEGTVERKWKNNVGGTLEFKGETLAKVELSLPLNLGLTGFDELAAAKSDLKSKTLTTADTRRTIEEEVRNGWSALVIARRVFRSLQNQASISAAFLDLARKERELGQRSLIDVLSGETSLINARSDSVSAEFDVAIAVYTLINAMGQLNYEMFETEQSKLAK